MDISTLIFGIAIGAVIGGLAAWLLAGRGSGAVGQSVIDSLLLAVKDETASTRKEAIEELSRMNDESRKAALELQKAQAEREREAVKNLVEPVEKHLKEVRDRVIEMDKASKVNRTSITEMVGNLSQRSEKLEASTNMLNRSLSSSQIRGGWGEKQLESLVEAAGMRKHLRNYRTQVATDEEGDRSRPDMSIAIPGQLEMLIDSKVPLESLMKAFQTEDPDERDAYLDAHADALRTQVLNLAKKNYPDKIDNSLDFVVLFVPGDHFLDLALSRRPELLEEALSKHVILTSPSSFFAVLLAVSNTWQQQDLAENAQAIADEGRELYKRLRKLLDHTSKLRKALNTAVESFNDMMGSFDTRVIPSARKMESLSSTDGKDPLGLPDPIDVVARESQKLIELPEGDGESS
ncbi:MAG: DNA recombination protein RmuC [Actinomycetes bacterium]